MEEVKKYPAPWDLNGKGYIIIYKFKKSFVEKKGNIPEFLKTKFVGGIGAVMLVDYQESNAGPYGELLLIPGKFKFKNKRLNTISKIYVSSMESVINGRTNWGIPKEKADFSFIDLGNNKEKATIKIDDKLVGEFIIKSSKFTFPVSTKLMPFPLVQEHENKYFYTNFFGSGKGCLGKIERIEINHNLFPSIDECKPLMVVKVDPFSITFPESIIKNK